MLTEGAEAKSFAKIAEVFRRLAVPSRTFNARESLLTSSLSPLLIFPNILPNIFPKRLLVFQNRSQPATVAGPVASSPGRVYEFEVALVYINTPFEPVLHGVVGSTVEAVAGDAHESSRGKRGGRLGAAPGARRAASQDDGRDRVRVQARAAPRADQRGVHVSETAAAMKELLTVMSTQPFLCYMTPVRALALHTASYSNSSENP